MSEDKNTTAADDLDVESAEASSVAGGRTSSEFDRTQDIEVEMFRLESEGYVPNACTTDGIGMVNPATKQQATVKTV